jgi:hypothetical protein
MLGFDLEHGVIKDGLGTGKMWLLRAVSAEAREADHLLNQEGGSCSRTQGHLCRPDTT